MSRKPLPPALAGLPLLGNAIGFGRDRQALLRRAYDRLGPIFTIRLGPKPVAVLVGPDYHQFFFTETDKLLSIEKPYTSLAAIFGKVAFLAPPEAYNEQRPILHAPFRAEKMRKYVAIMQSEIQKWIDSLGDQGEMELVGAVETLVQNIAGRALMGDDFHDRVGPEFWELYRVLGKSLSVLVPPEWPLPRHIRRDRAKRRMRELMRPVIELRRKEPEAHDDFLQEFLATPGRSGAPADDDTVIGLIRTLMFAGHETTAGQTAWTVIELLRHPDYLERVRAEVAAHLPAGAVADGPNLRQLAHVYWAVREVERLHPSADLLLRWVDAEFEIGGFRIPKDWLVMVSPALAHRVSSVFRQPERFDPLRYAPGREEDHEHPFALIGFGGGRHKCAGMSFANNEMALIAAMLVREMDLELLTPDPGVEFGVGAPRPKACRVSYRRK